MKFKALDWKSRVYNDGSKKLYAEVPKDLNIHNDHFEFWVDNGRYIPGWNCSLALLNTEQDAKDLANRIYEEQMKILVEKWFDDTK